MESASGTDAAAAVDRLDPEEAAERTFTAHRHDGEWLDAFSAGLDRRRAVEAFRRTTETWDLSQAEAARLFGVSRQAVGKWRSETCSLLLDLPRLMSGLAIG